MPGRHDKEKCRQRKGDSRERGAQTGGNMGILAVDLVVRWLPNAIANREKMESQICAS